MMILKNCDPIIAKRAATQILEKLTTPYAVEGYHVLITVSIGIRMCTARNAEHDMLVKEADAAMYVAKKQGKNGFLYSGKEEANFQKRNMAILIKPSRKVNKQGVLHLPLV